MFVKHCYPSHQVNTRVALNGDLQPQRLRPLTLIVEAVDAVDAGALVVPTEQKEVLGVLDLIGQQQADGLQRLLAPVHVVPQKQVVALWREAAVLEQPQKVVVLAMNVACDPENQVSTRCSLNLNPGPGLDSRVERSRDFGWWWGVPTFRKQKGLGRGLTTDLEGCLQLQKNGLAQENLPGFEAQTTDLVLCQLYILSRPRALHWEWNEASGPSGEKRVGDMGGPVGTSGGRLGLPGPASPRGSCCCSASWDPRLKPQGTRPPTTLKTLERGLLCAEACQNLRTQDPLLGGG